MYTRRLASEGSHLEEVWSFEEDLDVEERTRRGEAEMGERRKMEKASTGRKKRKRRRRRG